MGVEKAFQNVFNALMFNQIRLESLRTEQTSSWSSLVQTWTIFGVFTYTEEHTDINKPV